MAKRTREARRKMADKMTAQEPVERFWNVSTEETEEGLEEGHVYLYGNISSQSWWGDEVTPEQFRDDIESLGDITSLNIHIFSGGGDVFAGYAIYSIIKQQKVEKNIYIEGLAASIATVIAMAGDNIYISNAAMVMVHRPMALLFDYYNQNELNDMIDHLKTISSSMITIYANRTGLERSNVAGYIDGEKGEGTWFTAEEAIDAGFADEYIPDEAEEELGAVACIGGDSYAWNGVEVDLSIYDDAPKLKVRRRNKKVKNKNKNKPKAKAARKVRNVKAADTEYYNITCPECDATFELEAQDDDGEIIEVTCPECDATFEWNTGSNEAAEVEEETEETEGNPEEETTNNSYQNGVKAERKRIADLEMLATVHPEQMELITQAKAEGWSYIKASKAVLKAQQQAIEASYQHEQNAHNTYLDAQKKELEPAAAVGAATRSSENKSELLAAKIAKYWNKEEKK